MRSPLPRLAGAAVMALLSAPGIADAQQPHSRILGEVRDSTGTLVSDAAVVLLPTSRLTYTDFRGAFLFDSVPSGAYSLQVRRIGFLPQEHGVRANDGRDVQIMVTLIPRPALLEQVTVRVAEVGLRGVVHDLAREPIAGAQIVFTATGRNLRTDANGRFAWRRPAPGRHAVRVTAPGYSPRVFTVHIGEGEGREVSVMLTPSTQPPNNAEEFAWREFGQRQRWATSLATFLVEDDLQRGSPVRLSDHVQIRTEAGETPCVSVNGRRSVLPLNFFFTEDVVAVEILPPGGVSWTTGRRRGGASPPVNQPRGSTASANQCTADVYVWLKAL